MRPTAYFNGTIFTGEQTLSQKAILVQNGFIEDVVEESMIPASYERKDLGGMNISPSFIDLQIYGGNGKLFSDDLSVHSLKATYEYCVNGGAAHFMITMATNSIEKFLRGM